jgi:hypothetical protein
MTRPVTVLEPCEPHITLTARALVAVTRLSPHTADTVDPASRRRGCPEPEALAGIEHLVVIGDDAAEV